MILGWGILFIVSQYNREIYKVTRAISLERIHLKSFVKFHRNILSIIYLFYSHFKCFIDILKWYHNIIYHSLHGDASKIPLHGGAQITARHGGTQYFTTWRCSEYATTSHWGAQNTRSYYYTKKQLASNKIYFNAGDGILKCS